MAKENPNTQQQSSATFISQQQSPPAFMQTENTTGEPQLPPAEVIESNDKQPG